MARKISRKVKVSAVKDYVTSGESLRVVSARHGMSIETLRKYAMGKKRLKKAPVEAKKTVVNLENANRRWKIEEDEMLRDAVMSNFTVDQTVDLFGRSRASVMCRKHLLISNGFIDMARFKMPSGITRVRGLKSQPEIMKMIETPRNNEAKTDFSNLRDLAAVVKDLGVNVTVIVTPESTEIKMSN